MDTFCSLLVIKGLPMAAKFLAAFLKSDRMEPLDLIDHAKGLGKLFKPIYIVEP